MLQAEQGSVEKYLADKTYPFSSSIKTSRTLSNAKRRSLTACPRFIRFYFSFLGTPRSHARRTNSSMIQGRALLTEGSKMRSNSIDPINKNHVIWRVKAHLSLRTTGVSVAVLVRTERHRDLDGCRQREENQHRQSLCFLLSSTSAQRK